MLLTVTGVAGTGKSFLIYALQQLLLEKCVDVAFFGIAAFNIRGSTLHKLLQLPVGPRKHTDLTEDALSKLQQKMQGIEYLIIVDHRFSVVGQNMLG